MRIKLIEHFYYKRKLYGKFYIIEGNTKTKRLTFLEVSVDKDFEYERKAKDIALLSTLGYIEIINHRVYNKKLKQMFRHNRREGGK